MKKYLFLLLLTSTAFSQNLPYIGADGKMYKRVTTGVNAWVDSLYTLQAEATVDTSAGKIATQTMLALKQNTITNLADTSKYLESVALANITATGTPSASTYLRGDWTWNTPAGGGTWTELTRTGADTTMSVINTGIRVIGGLQFPMLANKAYAVEFWVVHGNVSATTSGMVLGFIAPAASVAALTALLPTAVDGVAGGWQGWLNGAKDSTVSTATPVVSVWFTSHIYGVIYNGANAGTFSVAWRPEVAANTTVRQNSFGNYKQLN